MKDTEELIKDLKLKDSSVRRHAIEMLGIGGGEKAVDALILVLKDKNRFVRQEAIASFSLQRRGICFRERRLTATRCRNRSLLGAGGRGHDSVTFNVTR